MQGSAGFIVCGTGGLAVLPAPLLAGIVGLLQPHSAFTYTLLAIAAGVALFLLFFQSWTLVLHSALSADETPLPVPRQEAAPHGADGDHPAVNAGTQAGSA